MNLSETFHRYKNILLETIDNQVSGTSSRNLKDTAIQKSIWTFDDYDEFLKDFLYTIGPSEEYSDVKYYYCIFGYRNGDDALKNICVIDEVSEYDLVAVDIEYYEDDDEWSIGVKWYDFEDSEEGPDYIYIHEDSYDSCTDIKWLYENEPTNFFNIIKKLSQLYPEEFKNVPVK